MTASRLQVQSIGRNLYFLHWQLQNDSHDHLQHPELKTQTMADQQLPNIGSAPNAAADARKNPCLVVTANHTIRMDEAPIAEPGEDEVLIHVRTTGICGSDLHFWKHGGIGSLTVDGDCILGHEAAGVVLAKGSGVDHLEIGM
jgi:hypothetical protein